MPLPFSEIVRKQETLERLLFVALILASLMPLWAFHYFPSQDGPAHLNNANILKEYFRPDADIFRKYFVISTQLNPNWCSHLMLAGLLYLFKPLIAEKIYLSIYVILLPVSARYALAVIDRRSTFYAFLAFPLIYNRTFQMGFYNFSCSLPMFFFFTGYWLQHRQTFAWRHVINLSLISLLLYFNHLVTLVMVYLLVSVFAAADFMADLAENNNRNLWEWPRVRKNFIYPGISLIPTILLAGWFLSGQQPARSLLPQRPIMTKTLHDLVGFISFQESEYRLLLLNAACYLVIALMIVWCRNTGARVSPHDKFIIVLAVYLAIFIWAPDTIIRMGGLLHIRLPVFFFFILILWFGTQRVIPGTKWAVIGASGLLSCTMLAMTMHTYAGLNASLEEYLSGSYLIDRHTTVLPLCFPPDSYDHSPVSPFLHATGYIAAEKTVIDFTNYEANQTYFPVKFRPRLNPYGYIGNMEHPNSGRLEILSYHARTGGTINYVLVWMGNHQRTSRDDRLLSQVDKGFEPIFTSKNGLMTLYRNRTYRQGEPQP